MLNILSILPLFFFLSADTIDEADHYVDEVVVVSARLEGWKRSAKGGVASIDEHVAELSHVNLVRRGSYAWEPVVNNMQTERLSTTIDGMKIFYACTDKMDPVTSYVESGNLQSISLNSGLDGNPQSTGNIGGSLDLKLKKVGFSPLSTSPRGDESRQSGFSRIRGELSTGYETNGHLQVYGADAAVSQPHFYANGGAFFRHAGNYKAGGGGEVDFSQFQKVNAFGNFGWRLAERDIVEGTFIYDCATNVGYPALNMDVAKAEGFITSLSYRRLFEGGVLNSWETKLYYNHITHVMDDTHRPDVEIHMDMPGKSWTSGLYSLLSATRGGHDVRLNYDLYYNRLLADMTMYPGGAAPMHMVTWPDVGTLNTGVAVNDVVSLPWGQSVRVSAKLAMQWQRLNSEEGRMALRVFFPGMKDAYRQTIGRVAASYGWRPGHWDLSLGVGWGSRAPTVTEAYGYYLNNTFDQYDYIGNPRLRNESAWEVNGGVKWRCGDWLTVGVDANAFFFSNYIIGEFENRLSAMTVDAEGVKVYGNIDRARIVNIAFTLALRPFPLGGGWKGALDTTLGYGVGRDAVGDPLPLICPFSHTSTFRMSRGDFLGNVTVRGNGRQVDCGRKYGEQETAAWVVVCLNAQYAFTLGDMGLTLRAGVENLLDRAYSAYSDWCGIPQKGRNVYVNLAFSL